MRHLVTLVSVFSLIISGCATVYSGPPPNFSLKGEEAKKEFEKFKWDEDYWRQNPRFVHMGPEKTWTYRSSLDPIIDEVSPAARQKIRQAQGWMLANGVLLTGVLVWLIGGASSGRTVAPEERTLFWASIGASVGTSMIIVPLVTQGASRQFNEDLKKKFAPGFALRTTF